MWISRCYITQSKHRKRMTFFKLAKYWFLPQDAFSNLGNSPWVRRHNPSKPLIMKTTANRFLFSYFSSVGLFGYLNVSLGWCLKSSKERVQEEKTRKETDGPAALPRAWKGLDHTGPDPPNSHFNHNQYGVAEFDREACEGKASRVTKRGLAGCLLPGPPAPPAGAHTFLPTPPSKVNTTPSPAKPGPRLAASFVLRHADHLFPEQVNGPGVRGAPCGPARCSRPPDPSRQSGDPRAGRERGGSCPDTDTRAHPPADAPGPAPARGTTATRGPAPSRARGPGAPTAPPRPPRPRPSAGSGPPRPAPRPQGAQAAAIPGLS